jgi:hypothetical protein
MKTLQLREKNSVVYFLSSDGFKKGWVKSIHVDQETLKVLYRVTHSENCEIYMGEQKGPDEVFDTYEDMLAHFMKMKF